MSNNKSENHSYSVGDVVYLLSDKKQAIIPALVIEETVVNTLEGKKISWKFAAGPEGKKRVFSSNEMKSEIFSSLEELEDLLQQRFSKLIKDTISQARKFENVWYGSSIKKKQIIDPVPTPVKTTTSDPTDSLLEDLGGEPTNEIFNEKFHQISQDEQKTDIRTKLREQIRPSEEELRQEIKFENEDNMVVKDMNSEKNPNMGTITLPDGNKVSVDMGV